MVFLVFFLLNPLRLEFSRIRKTTLFLTAHMPKKYKNQLHEWSKNVVNVENPQVLKRNCKFLLVIWVKWKQSGCFITSLILVLFTPCFYNFLFRRYLNSNMTSFSSEILLPFPNSNDLNSHVKGPPIIWFVHRRTSYDILFLPLPPPPFKNIMNIFINFFYLSFSFYNTHIYR